MKKKIFFLVIAILTLTIILCGCVANVNNQDETKANFVAGTSPYETLKTFVKQFPNRTSGVIDYSTGSAVNYSENVAKWLSTQFENMDYSASFDNGLQEFNYDNPYTNQKEKSYNVIYKKESSKTKKVVIGAHYDNVTDLVLGDTAFGGDGTYNNGVGIATLLELAKVLNNKYPANGIEELPFDVEFVAFGAGETGNFGALKYLNSQNNIDDILLMINFDRNAIGDYVYMYSSEAKTEHNKFFYDIAKQNKLCIADLPGNLSPILIGNATNNGIYVNEAMLTDSDVFLNNGINIVNFISMNFSAKGGAAESEGNVNIAYTQNDNFDNVVKRLGGEAQAERIISKQINSAISTVVYAFEHKDFVSTMQNSKANGGQDALLKASTMAYIAFGISGGLILLLLILYFSLRTTIKPHDVYINTVYGRVNVNTGKIVDGSNQPINENKANSFEEIFDEFKKEASKNNSKDAEVVSEDKKDKDKDIFGDY